MFPPATGLFNGSYIAYQVGSWLGRARRAQPAGASAGGQAQLDWLLRRPPPPHLAQVAFYSLTVILVASFVLCAFVGHNFKTGTFPWVRQSGGWARRRRPCGRWPADQPAPCCSPVTPACSCGPSRC